MRGTGTTRAASRSVGVVGALVVLAGTLAGCGDDAGSGGAGDEPAGDAALTTADSDLGEIVVDGDGMTVYYFASDEPGSGESTCTDDCLAAWPPVHADDEEPQVEGVTAEVGTIEGNDGERQLTLDGRPLYLYVEDEAPGDVTGQGVNDVWWVVAPDGTEVTEAPSDTDVGGY